MAKVLLVDDNKEILETLERIFRFYDYQVEKAENGQEALDLAERSRPNLILLDGMMPVMDGFEACKILKSQRKTKDIPVVFLTANFTKDQDKLYGLELGADDYLTKPFNSKELVARTNAILKRSELLQTLKRENEKLTHRNRKIEKEFEDIIQRSKDTDKNRFIDQLTGLYSFEFFKRRLAEELERTIRYDNKLSVIIAQIHHLDRINDKFGFQFGNYLLTKMSNFMLSKTRTSDILARADSGYFYLILPQTDKQGAYLEAERLRVTMATADFIDDELLETMRINRKKILEYNNIEVNVGVVSYEKKSGITSWELLLKKTEEVLKTSVSQGKNKTVALEL